MSPPNSQYPNFKSESSISNKPNVWACGPKRKKKNHPFDSEPMSLLHQGIHAHGSGTLTPPPPPPGRSAFSSHHITMGFFGFFLNV